MLLKASQVKKSFGGVHAVADGSFEVSAGQISALVGPNGAGKTTMFNLISGLMLPDSGTIQFEGADITKEPAWKRARRGVSRTFQLSRLFKNLSIEDNLLLALREDDDNVFKMIFKGEKTKEEVERVKEVMRFVGLEKPAETTVTDLSYGQQKLFDLARALIQPHSFLMLDEPVAGVNPVLREKLKTLLRTLKQDGETILVIEHDMDFIRGIADKVIVMDQGKVIAEGEPEAVFSDKKVLEAYLGV